MLTDVEHDGIDVNERPPEGSELDEDVDGRGDGADSDEGRGVSLNQIVALVLAIIGVRIGLQALGDNSFLTHLATGRWILDNGAVPDTDPYSFTAVGQPWTVQSWGASVLYAALDRTVGLVGIRIVVAMCTTALILTMWRLTGPARTLSGRLLVLVPALAVAITQWGERPLIFGLLGLGLVLLAVQDEIDPRWLIGVMWIWVNVHGTFVFALIAIGAFGLGRLLDRERPTVEIRAFAWAALGTALGAINPQGPRLLVFPFQLLTRREAFTTVVEWQPPTWSYWNERFFAVQLVLAVALIAWRGRRWRNVIPVLLFAGLALQSTRNIAQASMVLLPVMAIAAEGIGTIDGERRLPILKPVRAVLVALLVLIAIVGVRFDPNVNLAKYPVESVTWMRAEGLLDRSDRVVSRDFVGNYLEARYGPDRVRVYMDDRVDMFPIDHIEDYRVLLNDGGDYATVLDNAGATAVLWDLDTPFAAWIQDPKNGWEVVHRDGAWLVAVPADGDTAS